MNEATKIDIEKHLVHASFMMKLEDLQKEKGLNKSQLAKKLGFTRSFMSQLFAGTRFINIEHLAKIQRYLDTNVKIEFQDRESIRIKNDPKRFHISYVSEISYPTDNPIGTDDLTRIASGTI